MNDDFCDNIDQQPQPTPSEPTPLEKKVPRFRQGVQLTYNGQKIGRSVDSKGNPITEKPHIEKDKKREPTPTKNFKITPENRQEVFDRMLKKLKVATENFIEGDFNFNETLNEKNRHIAKKIYGARYSEGYWKRIHIPQP